MMEVGGAANDAWDCESGQHGMLARGGRVEAEAQSRRRGHARGRLSWRRRRRRKRWWRRWHARGESRQGVGVEIMAVTRGM